MKRLPIFLAAAASALSLGSQDLKTILDEALQDEWLARSTYEAVIAKLGPVRPFSQIVNAEKTHAARLLQLYAKYKLTPPADASARRTGETVAQFVKRMKIPATVREAAQNAYNWELGNIAMYDRLLKNDLSEDVLTVFRALRSASKDRHLPAFARAARRR